MRLIDADLLIAEIKMLLAMHSYCSPLAKETMYDFIDGINSEPTAFDIEKVVNELEARKDFCKGEWQTFLDEYYRVKYMTLDEAIKIIRGGLNE